MACPALLWIAAGNVNATDGWGMLLALQSLVGLVVIPMMALAMSEDRGALKARGALRVVLAALAVQAAIALLLLKLPAARYFFEAVGGVVEALQRATDAGMQLVFGYLAGGPPPFDVKRPENAFVLGLRGLPLILVLSAIVRLLYHWGVLQAVVGTIAALLRRLIGVGGPLGTVSAASIFLGLVEAPLLIRPYLDKMSRGALFAVMVVVMATVAGTVMALYASLLQPVMPGAAGHLLAASLMNVPAALMLARIVVPAGFGEGPATSRIVMADAAESSMDAVVKGTMEGMRLLATVIAMLVVIVALVALVNMILALVTAPLGGPVTLQGALGMLCAPLAWMMGIPWSEAGAAGSLLGQKLVLNEFIAYLDLARTPEAALSPRSRLIMTYALCGFANLGSLGILIGGLTAMAPERRAEIVALAPRSVVVGFLATMLSGAMIGLMTG